MVQSVEEYEFWLDMGYIGFSGWVIEMTFIYV
jgi:hypothetical protein